MEAGKLQNCEINWSDINRKTMINKWFRNNYTFVREPKGELLGNVDLREFLDKRIEGVGDFAGVNNLQNGGGIYRSIKSAAGYCKGA